MLGTMMTNLLDIKYAGLGIVPACVGFDRRAGRRVPWTRSGRDRARVRVLVAGLLDRGTSHTQQRMKILLLILLLAAAMSATASDWRRSAVAACLVREAGIDGREGMTAVMDVIVNRCKISGRTPYQEVVRRKQFSSMSVGVSRAVRDASKSSAWLYALHVASHGVEEWRWPVTKGATHYYAPEMLPRAPYWARGMEYKTTIRRHRFYREV